MIYATFIMEQHLGHQVYYQNLRQFLDEDKNVKPTWVPVTYTDSGSFWERIPFAPKRLLGSYIGRLRVMRGINKIPFDVAYFNTQVPAVLHDPRRNGRPYVIATDITPIQYDQMAAGYSHHPDGRGPIGWIKHRTNSRILCGAARLLPWSSWAAASLISDYGVDAARVEVLPVGVDLNQWQPVDTVRRAIPRILFVGGDFYRKGGSTLLDAFRSLPCGSAELIMVTRSAVQTREGEKVYANIVPNSREIHALYQESDIFALPSHAEAFGISAVEASASGLPVVAARTGGLTDIVVDQETGFLIPAGDIVACANCLRILIENVKLRRQMGAAAYQRAQTRFDARKIAARVADILAATVSEREKS